MDLFVVSHMASEDFAPYSPYREDRTAKAKAVLGRLTPAVLLGILASWLAWSSNKNLPLPDRLALSVAGFVFGGLYLIYYALFSKCKR